jgi:hypothetical protein
MRNLSIDVIFRIPFRDEHGGHITIINMFQIKEIPEQSYVLVSIQNTKKYPMSWCGWF